MTLNQFNELFEEACGEAYKYFDRHIRRLPKKADGAIDPDAPSLNDNDVDAFRHAYVSGVFTRKYGEKTADVLGLLNEYDPFGQLSHSASPRSRNMDLWNNRVGRKYGNLTRDELVALIQAGEYPGYSVKVIRGVETPVSKRDGKRINNIG